MFWYNRRARVGKIPPTTKELKGIGNTHMTNKNNTDLTVSKELTPDNITTPKEIQLYMMMNGLKRSIKALAFIRALANRLNLTLDEWDNTTLKFYTSDKTTGEQIHLFTLIYSDYSFAGKVWLVRQSNMEDLDLTNPLQSLEEARVKAEEEAEAKRLAEAEAEATLMDEAKEFIKKLEIKEASELKGSDIEKHKEYTDYDYFKIFKGDAHSMFDEFRNKFNDFTRAQRDNTLNKLREWIISEFPHIKQVIKDLSKQDLERELFKAIKKYPEFTPEEFKEIITNQFKNIEEEDKATGSEVETPEIEVI